MRRPPDRRVVLADVARLAGTSEATASRALKDDPRIGEATRAAVRAAALKLGYVPNAAARSLRARGPTSWASSSTTWPIRSTARWPRGSRRPRRAAGLRRLHDDRAARPGARAACLTAFVEHRADGVALASCVSDPADVFRRRPNGSGRLRPAGLPRAGRRGRTPGAWRPPHRRPGGRRRHRPPRRRARLPADRLCRAGQRLVGRAAGARPRARRSRAWTRTAALHRFGTEWLARRVAGCRATCRGSAGRRDLLRRQARAEPARCASLDSARRAAGPRAGGLRRHPGGAPVAGRGSRPSTSRRSTSVGALSRCCSRRPATAARPHRRSCRSGSIVGESTPHGQAAPSGAGDGRAAAATPR